MVLNGTGGVISMAKAKQLPSGNWRALCYAGKGPDGKRKYESITAPTEKECNYLALEFELKHKEISKDSGNMTLKEAIKAYIDSKDGILSPATITGYRRKSKNHLQGLLNCKLNKLSQEMIQRAINDEAKKHSPKTVRDVHGLLSAVLKVYRPDFALRTTLPKKQKYFASIPQEAEISKIVQIVKGTEIELPVLLSVWLSLRMSELRGIEWSSIKGNKLYINQAIVDTEDGSVLKRTPKTNASNRILEIPPYIMQLINKTPKEGRFLISLSGQAIYKRFVRLCEKNGLGHFRFHDLRHANASIMLALNVPTKYAQERGGWETDSTLKSVYQHTFSEQRKIVDQKMDAYFENLMQHEIQHEDPEVN
jgi:integrase